ncbi:MAG: type II secretion system protein GspL [Burkholderiaceae bacterium]
MKPPPASRLLVLLPPRRDLVGKHDLDSGTEIGFLLLRAGAIEAGRSPIALLPAAARIELVFDAADIYSAEIEAPPLPEGKLRLALPHLLEDRLLADPADNHVAVAPRQAGGKLPVAVISRAWLARVTDLFTAAGRAPATAWSSLYLIPAPTAGVVSLRLGESRGVLRSGEHEGLAFDLDAEPAALIDVSAQRLGATAIKRFGHMEGALPTSLPIEVSGAVFDPAASSAAIDLLQGSFATRGRWPKVEARALRAPLAWSALALVVAIGGLNLYWFKLDNESRSLRAEMVAAFRSTFPRETAVIDPIAQARRQLTELRARAGLPSPDDFSVLNARLAQLFAAAPVGIVDGIDYRDGSLTLKLKPQAANDAGLHNSLRAAAVQQGLDLRFEPDGSAKLRASGN